MRAQRCRREERGFTLTELLVVMVVIALLAALLFPVVAQIQHRARVTACVSNLRQIGAAIALYAGDYEGKIPYGPKAPGFNNAGNFYPSTGAPTSLISLQDGQPVALGLLLENYLTHNPRVLFCPGCDQKLEADIELAKVGKGQAQCGYYYRHGGNTDLMDNPRAPKSEPPLRLGALGDNRNGKPIRALVIDTIFIAPEELESFGVRTLTNHEAKSTNILFTDGHVSTVANDNGQFVIDVQDLTKIRTTFSKILDIFEAADEIP